MSSENAVSNSKFVLQDPVLTFEDYSRAEVRRLEETDPQFDSQLYMEAIDLVLVQMGVVERSRDS
ncbi:MAG: hypothetical protein H7832_05595 [Magnetococcus sp. DMHC-6]